METPAAAAPAGGFFPSFLLLGFATLVAALLGAAHRLGLFYQLMHKVQGKYKGDGPGAAKGMDFQRSFQLTHFIGGESEVRLIQRDWSGNSFQYPVAVAELLTGLWTLPLGRGHREATPAWALNPPPTSFLRGLEPFSRSSAP